MAELSNAVGLVWVTAAGEATDQLHHEFIEPERAFIALCRATELVDEKTMQEARAAGVDAAAFRAELELVPVLLRELGRDPRQLRRELRGVLGTGRFQRTPNQPIHRSDRCKLVFDLADKLTSDMGMATVQTAHLTLTILEAPDCRVISFLKDRAIDPNAFAGSIRKVLAGKRKIEVEPPVQEPPRPAANGDPRAGKANALHLDYLLRFGRDLTQLAREGKLKSVIGRREEMRQLARTLACSDKNNPLLIGEPGAGKTAVVEGLARRIARGEVSEATGLANKRIWSLDMGLLGAGTQYRGEFGQRLTRRNGGINISVSVTSRIRSCSMHGWVGTMRILTLVSKGLAGRKLRRGYVFLQHAHQDGL